MTPWVEGSYERLKAALPEDKPGYFENKKKYKHRCSKCGYSAIRNLRWITCGCGERLTGDLVYMKIDGKVVLDKRYQ